MQMSTSVPPLPHIVTTAVEHPCVLNVCRHLERIGYCSLSVVPVDKQCRVSVQDVMSCIVSETCLVTIMHANNEIGAVQPIAELAQALKEAFPSNMRPVFHTDASQTLGKIPVDVEDLGVDLLTVAAHKFYAPKGIGALVAKKRQYVKPPLKPLFLGGGQEQGLRPGTLAVPLIVGLGLASELAEVEWEGGFSTTNSDCFVIIPEPGSGSLMLVFMSLLFGMRYSMRSRKGIQVSLAQNSSLIDDEEKDWL